jgi:GNAT superfamily N-acetyltransferase
MTPGVTSPVWGDLSTELHAARLRHFAQVGAGEVREADGAFAVVTGAISNIENGIVCERPVLAAGVARDLIGWVLERGVPASWMAEVAVSDELHAELLGLGCREETTGVDMGARLADLELTGVPPAGIEVEEARDGAGLEAWLDVAQACGWFGEPATRAGQGRLYGSLGLGPDRPIRHWLARRNGEAVGMATAFLRPDAVLLEHLAVLPDERRRGIGTALALARLREAANLGCTAAVLGPTADSQPFYETFGFSLTSSPPRRWYYLPAGP